MIKRKSLSIQNGLLCKPRKVETTVGDGVDVAIIDSEDGFDGSNKVRRNKLISILITQDAV